MFVLVRGSNQVSKQEYSYARRAQSVTMTLCWKDIAMINTEDQEEAIAEALAAIGGWEAQGFKSDRWRLEGRGKNIHVNIDLREVSADLCP
jgi:hypothetical protein